MALNEDLTVFLSDFGVSCTAGAINALGILDMPSQLIATDGLVLSTDYTLTARAADFGGLLYGDGIRVDGVNYQVRETRRVDDGAFVEIALSKLAPDATAPGGQPRSFGLDDLSDVALATPTAGEVLKYNGTNWVDGTTPSPSFTFTQSTPAATWTITHNLGFVPSVELFNTGSQEIDGDVVHTSYDVTMVYFTQSIAGFARLN